MAGLTDIKYLYGLSNLTVIDRTNDKPKYLLRVVSSMNVDSKVDYDKLTVGGVDWASEEKASSYSLKFEAYEYAPTVMEHLSGGQLTTEALNAAGEVVHLANVKGTSAYNSTTGIASFSVATLADLKWGKYVAVVTAATKIKIYGLTGNVSFNDGTNIAFADDTLQVGSEITVVAATPEDITELGLHVTGGSGTIGMTIGDTCTFEIRRGTKTGYRLVVGGLSTVYEDVKIIGTFKQTQSTYRAVEIPKVKISGLPLEAGDSYSKYSVTADILYDSGIDGFYRYIEE
jgi:hypothetical protein